MCKVGEVRVYLTPENQAAGCEAGDWWAEWCCVRPPGLHGSLQRHASLLSMAAASGLLLSLCGLYIDSF